MQMINSAVGVFNEYDEKALSLLSSHIGNVLMRAKQAWLCPRPSPQPSPLPLPFLVCCRPIDPSYPRRRLPPPY